METTKEYIEVTVTKKPTTAKRIFRADTLFEIFKQMQEAEIIENYLDDNQILIQDLAYYIDFPDINSDAIYEIDFDKKVSKLTYDQLKEVIRSYLKNSNWLTFDKMQDVKINGHTLRVSENTYHCLDAYLNHVENCQYYGIAYVDEANRLESYFIQNLCADNNVDILLDILERCECTSDELIEQLRTLTF